MTKKEKVMLANALTSQRDAIGWLVASVMCALGSNDKVKQDDIMKSYDGCCARADEYLKIFVEEDGNEC